MTTPPLPIYDLTNLDSLEWPDNPWCRTVQHLFPEMMRRGTRYYIDNIDAPLSLLKIDSWVLPLVQAMPSAQNSYVCSPYCHFVTYGEERIETIPRPFQKSLLKAGLQIYGAFLRGCAIDRVLFVNHWLVPTNLHPDLSRGQLARITETLTARYPSEAIVFRSINPLTTPSLAEALKHLGYSFILNRYVYVTDTREEAPFRSRMFKSDQKLYDSSSYRSSDQPDKVLAGASRISALYKALNIDKYSSCNPQFNENFIRLALEAGWMRFQLFEDPNGRPDAVYGYFSHGHIMTSPFFGYDTSAPQDAGLYRLIATDLLLRAQAQHMTLHQSAGAGHYKKLRRAQEVPEYLAVYTEHLEFKKRFSWKMIEEVMEKFGRKFMEEN